MGIVGGEVAAGAGGDPAAEAGELEGLREVAEREAVGPELVLERGAKHARLEMKKLLHPNGGCL